MWKLALDSGAAALGLSGEHCYAQQLDEGGSAMFATAAQEFTVPIRTDTRRSRVFPGPYKGPAPLPVP